MTTVETHQTPYEPGAYSMAPPWAAHTAETEVMAPWAGHPAETEVMAPWAGHPAGTEVGPPWAGHPVPAEAAMPPADSGAAAETAEFGPLPFGGTVPPYGSPGNKHGQLLVRFPHEVLGAARPEAPSWRPVVAWTFFFSALGVISAMRRAGKAHAYGRNRLPYYVAFLATLAGGAAFWSALAFNVVLPLQQQHVESRATEAVQSKVLGDGRVEAAVGTEVKSGGCVPAGSRGADGLRAYDCTFQLADGRSATMTIMADLRGNWETTK
ncbi:hypothetical protein BJY16_003028 [Actinoplanes octamycinicus]|uniref:DUF4333 domain-containing protein n=1 Tax=Actinoplanes octamycinicus TaxID=135948 RepID=A0A7W7GWG3_9ACTN|nr:hypothetical protein [Actinoplanes octamycinicus]MBB4739569.1 hypothetical protein [Actinoplanes octamycinicus]GIE54750.1 hypothetical protein Aoc01nite_01520 [Actinoplanes octamycinicus]